MLPSPMLILAVVLAFVANGFYWNAHGSNAADTRWTAKITAERLAATEAARKQEETWQGVVNATSKAYLTRIGTVRGNLDVALNGLRERPERPGNLPETARTDVKDCNGAELARSHAEFLERYAATAATQDAALNACYGVLDAVAK